MADLSPLGRFSKDVGYTDDLLPSTIFDFLQVRLSENRVVGCSSRGAGYSFSCCLQCSCICLGVLIFVIIVNPFLLILMVPLTWR
jgi:hypothetical protein